MSLASPLSFFPIVHLPEIQPADELAQLIGQALVANELVLQTGDCLVVAQKIVSKAENRLVDLATIVPSPFACELAARQRRDPRLIEVVLRESSSIVRMDDHVLITTTKHGFVCANAGVDKSNVVGADWVALLPLDPDASAERLRQALQLQYGVALGVIITDTFGRAWREGLTNVAIGVAGFNPLDDFRGGADDHGKPLAATVLAVADEIAAASGLLMRKTARIPVVLARGFTFHADAAHLCSAQRLIRPKERDLFR